MAALLTNALVQVGQLHKADDDIIDRFNHRFTVILLVTFTGFIGAKQFIGNPISCWTPAHFSDSHVSYTNSICWLKGTYFLEADRRLIPHHTENSEFHIAYYQFVPYILLVMALLFYFPHIFWRNLSRRLGFDLRSIIQNIKDIRNTDIDKLALQIHVALECNSSKYIAQRYRTSSNRLLKVISFPLRFRTRLTILYIFVKLLYITNCLCQFYFLSTILSFSFYTFGIDWISIMLKRFDTTTNRESKWFPRVVMCNFMVRHLGSNQHWNAIQCNLPINLFNEIIFLIIWAWLLLLTGLTCISLISCLFSIHPRIARTFIDKYFHMNTCSVDKQEKNEFTREFLNYDGLLVLRIIAHNTNDVIMANLIGALFKRYLNTLETTKSESGQ